MYLTEEGVTKVVPLNMMYKQVKKASDFKEAVINYLDKPFMYEINYYNKFVDVLKLTQTFFFEQ
jgi:hypothetical protein